DGADALQALPRASFAHGKQLSWLRDGANQEGIWSTDVIAAMVEMGEDVRVINGSEAAKFLESKDFWLIADSCGCLEAPESALSLGNRPFPPSQK
ncbi:hypothetical protein, partial [Xanthomonas cucurbitae]|uniref:hypothetical protein n=1 Tax=Xanthomonas cucurbitae TaxID=56453 RepID=UPI0011B0AD4D